MKNEDALKVLKQLVDLCVQKGVFSSADEVLTTVSSYNHVAKTLLSIEQNVQVSDTTKA
jgi:hypothetical protein